MKSELRDLLVPTTAKRPGAFLFATILDRELVHDQYPTESAPRLNFYIFHCLAGDAATSNAPLRPAQHQPITAPIGPSPTSQSASLDAATLVWRVENIARVRALVGQLWATQSLQKN
jgi:hypothetical protein